MGLKPPGVRGSLRNVSVGTLAIPDSGDLQWYVDEGTGGTLNPDVGSITQTITGATWQSLSSATGGHYLELDGTDDRTASDSTITLSDPFTVFGWIRPQNFAFSGFSSTVWANQDLGTDAIGHGIADGDTAGTLNTGAGDGSPSGVLADVPFVGNGSWGFFGLIRSGTEHRLITFDNSQELADQTASNAVASSTPTDTVFWGDGRYGHAQMDLDFHGFANSALSKSDLTDLWEATQR